jgi:adenylosuccinate lyase
MGGCRCSSCSRPATLEESFDLGYHLKHVDTMFARVFGDAPGD